MIQTTVVSADSQFPNFVDLVEQTKSAVVNIKVLDESGDDLSELQFDLAGSASGSGFILSEDGFIITNHHVIEEAKRVVVRLNDRNEYEAEVIGSDADSDVALLKIEAKGLPVLKLSSSSSLQVGEWVIAIGSPFGFDHSVTQGIVSATKRSLPDSNYVPFIQTDVAINPGNSGGPLLNLKGEVVGVNSQILSQTGGYIGLSFAIPIEIVTNVAKQLEENGKVSRGWLGVLIQEVTGKVARDLKMKKPHGAYIAQVFSEGPAGKSGLQEGDVILEFDGVMIDLSSQLPLEVGIAEIGETVDLVVLRDGKEVSIPVRIEALPESNTQAQLDETTIIVAQYNVEDMGITVSSGAEEGGSGVFIVNLQDNSPADLAGLEVADMIVELNQIVIQDLEQFAELLKSLPNQGKFEVVVVRDGVEKVIKFAM